MWRCANCNESMNESYNFCWKCGHKRVIPVPTKEGEIHNEHQDFSLFASFRENEEHIVKENNSVITESNISWLLIRGLGLYLLLNAFMALPDLISAISIAYAYSNILSSVSSFASSEGGSYGEMLGQLNDAYTGAYKNILMGPVLRIGLFSVASVYLLRGGEFLFRLLSHRPNAE